LFKDTTCAFFHSGFGFETFIIPGDTIRMNIGKRNIKEIRNGYIRPWSNDITFLGKNKYIYSLFDSLSTVAGPINFGSEIKLNDDTLSFFLTKIKQQYQSRHKYLENYCEHHLISWKIKKLAEAEVYNFFIKELLSPLIFGKLTLKDYPDEYQNMLKNFNFNDQELYFKTHEYYVAANLTVENNYYTQAIDNANAFAGEYDFIKKSTINTEIKDHMLTLYLVNCLRSNDSLKKSFDPVYLDYKGFCSNAGYKSYTDSLYKIKKAVKPRTFTFKDALNAEIKDSSGVPYKIENLLRHKPLIIICWASLCVRCIKEVPDEKMLEKQYGGKVDFVYLSFDKYTSKWKSKATDLKIGDKSYVLTLNFESDFSHFYKINSIPRYIVYDSNGNQIDIKDARPSNHKSFEAVMNPLINKN
jgi:thiol-disulfide isomerase/thioredoxin